MTGAKLWQSVDTNGIHQSLCYLHKPEEAEVYYRAALEKDPDNFGATMGLFHVYSDLRQWEKASQTLGRLEEIVEKEKKALAWNESVLAKQRYLADSNSQINTRGWFLLYQDRLKEGQAYFDYYLGEAASETGLRSGLAHAYLWRHWPRRALEQFEINRNLDPQDVGRLTGLGWTLIALNYKREARALADDLHQRHPTHLNVYDLWETLKMEDMWRLQRTWDERGERPMLTDHPLDPKAYAANIAFHYELLGKYSGECEAVAAWRAALRRSTEPPPLDAEDWREPPDGEPPPP